MSSPNQSEPETEIEKELEYETVVVKEDGEHYNDDDDHAVLEASETTQCSFISFEPEESGKIYLEDETNEDEEEIIKDNDASGTLTMEPLIVETDGESTRHSDDSMIDNSDEKQIDNTVDDEEKLEEQNVNDEIESEKDENCIEEALEAEPLETEINSKATVSDVDKTSDTRIAEKRKANDVNDNKEDFLGFGEDDFDVFDEIKMQNLIVIVRMIEKAKDESVEESIDQLDDEPKAKRAKPLNSIEGENDIQTVTEKKQSTITTKIQTNSSGRRKSVNMTKECDIEMEDESMIEDDAESPPELIIDQNENDNEHDDFDDIEDKDKDSIDNRKEATSKLTSRNKSNSSSGRGTPSSVQKPKPITDEIYRRPFNMGWKREVVYRAIPGISKDKGEVYYITPNGKKLRTKNDIIANLTNGLSIDNFTFAKAPIGMGEEYEIIRNAKPITRYVPPLVSLGKRVPKPKGPKGASPPPMGWTATKAVITQTQITPVVRTSTVKKPSQDGVDLMKPTTSSQSSKPSVGKTSIKKNTPFKPNTTLNWEQTPKSAKYPRISARRVGGGSVPYVRSPRTKDEKHYEDDNEGSPAHRRLQRNDKKHVCPANAFEANFFGNVASGYNILLHTFQYLKVQELLQVSSVCRFWNVAANHRSLWKTIRMKNSQVNDWTGLAAALKRNETKHLDMRKMLIISSKGEEMWKSFAKNIRQVTSLENIDICRCSSKIVQDLFVSNPNLKIVNAVTIRDDAFCLDKVKNLKGLEELRLKSTEGFSLIGDLSPLSNLKNLKHLSLTSFKSLCSQGVKPLANLVNLETLELGDCDDLDITFAEEVLPKLTKIERLRLERGVGDICTLEIMDTISRLERLTQLELVNFDVKRGFDDKLIQCKNLKRLLIIPTYISASATTNQIILNATLNMSDILEVFTWAVTMELLRVTSLYVDQCENRKDDPNFEECIPVLQPVPGMVYKRPMDPIQQVEILPLKRIEEIVSQLMPRTKLKILKVPYHATWRQTIFVGRVASASSSVSSCTSNSSSTTRSRRERGTSDT